MPTESKTWLQKSRDRLSASKSLDYVIGVAEGTEDYDAGRYKAAEFICNKLIPNPPTATVELEPSQLPDFNVIYSSD